MFQYKPNNNSIRNLKKEYESDSDEYISQDHIKKNSCEEENKGNDRIEELANSTENNGKSISKSNEEEDLNLMIDGIHYSTFYKIFIVDDSKNNHNFHDDKRIEIINLDEFLLHFFKNLGFKGNDTLCLLYSEKDNKISEIISKNYNLLASKIHVIFEANYRLYEDFLSLCSDENENKNNSRNDNVFIEKFLQELQDEQ